MTHKGLNIIGWVLTVGLALLFGMSAFMKLSPDEESLAQAAAIGLDAATFQFIGIVEITSLILFLIPRTGLVGALFLMAYMGGAIVTHLEHQDSIVMPVIVQIALWVTAFIRFPELKVRLFSTEKTN